MTRRSLVKGLAWSVPVIATATTAPAYAVLVNCAPQIDAAFTAAEQYVRQNYYCNGQPVKLQINLYHAAGALNGFVQTLTVNVKNLSGCNVNFSATYPLNLDIQIRNANVVTNSRRRSINRVATSWGSNETAWTSYDINAAPVGTVEDQIDWRFSGTLPGAGLGDNEADLAIDLGDGLSGVQRWNDYITTTPLATSGVPTFASTGAPDTAQCRAYHQQKLSTWVSPFQSYVLGSKAPYNTGDGVAISAGTMIDSRVIGNNSALPE